MAFVADLPTVCTLVSGKDQGINIRHKVQDMIEFIQDDDRLREERKKAKKNKDKYVGMSNDSMGFRGRSGGFDSGWQSNWPSRSGGGSGGFRDRSPDFEEAREASPDVDDFKDDNNEDFGYEPAPAKSNNSFSPRPASAASNNSFGGAMSQPASTATAGNKNSKAKVRKPIDLGAAASFAQQQRQEQQSTPSKSNNVQKNTQLINDLFSQEDDFNPRGSDSNANNGDFGNFTAAFPETKSDNSLAQESDDFADFSSAFSGNQNNAPAPAPAPPSKENSFDSDLLAPASSASQPSTGSNFDLLGGLDVGNSSLPPLVQQTPNLFDHAPPAPASSILSGLSPASGSNSLMMSAMSSGPTSLPPTLLQPNNSNLPKATAMASGMNNNANLSAGSKAALPQTWGDVGKLNIDLDNLSLGGKNQNKKSVPMNAMKQSPSSSGGPSAPLGLAPVQPQQQQQFMSNNDLL